MERLKFIRQALGKTQKEMAQLLGVSLRAYQMYEEGKTNIPLPKLRILASQFGVNINWLLTGEGEPFLTLKEEPVKKKKTLQAV